MKCSQTIKACLSWEWAWRSQVWNSGRSVPVPRAHIWAQAHRVPRDRGDKEVIWPSGKHVAYVWRVFAARTRLEGWPIYEYQCGWHGVRLWPVRWQTGKQKLLCKIGVCLLVHWRACDPSSAGRVTMSPRHTRNWKMSRQNPNKTLGLKMNCLGHKRDMQTLWPTQYD